jgi:hypothetical protein
MSTTINTPKSTQATINILGNVRLFGTIVFVCIFALSSLSTVLGAAFADNHVSFFLFGAVVSTLVAVSGAIFYATIGWFVETLKTLVQIAENTSH